MSEVAKAVDDIGEVRKKPLREILGDLSEAETHADTPAERYAAFFGKPKPDAKEEMAALAEKIEASFAKIDEWENGAASWQGQADRYAKLAEQAQGHADALMNRSRGLREYMAFWLRENHFERVPGVSVNAIVKRASNPKTIIGRVAQPTDMQAFPDLVEQIPRSYRWDVKEICRLLKALAKRDLTKEPMTDVEAKLVAFARLEYSYSLDFTPREVAP